MAAYKPRKGSYEVDRVIPPLGRVRLRTGTQDKRLAERYEAMLDALPLDTVKLIRDKQLTLRVAYDAWSAGHAASLPSAQTLRPLIATFRSWLAAPLKAVGDAETKARAHVVTVLEQLAAPAAQLRDLPTCVRGLRQTYATKGPAFNRARASCLAFVRDLLGRRHELYDAVVSVPVLPEPPKLARHPCTVAEARAIARQPGRVLLSPRFVLACSGVTTVAGAPTVPVSPNGARWPLR